MYASIANYPEPVREFLKRDRQWPRHLRVKHASARLEQSVTADDQAFWRDVLKANATFIGR